MGVIPDSVRLANLGLSSNPFMIDGVAMPIPDTWQTNPKIMTSDSHRTVSTGRLVAAYLQTVWETSWTYKVLWQEDYDRLYAAYITSCDANKSIEHSFSTLDSNTGRVLTYRMYTQDDFSAPLYMIRNGRRMYTDVTFTFVGVGGGE